MGKKKVRLITKKVEMIDFLKKESIFSKIKLYFRKNR